MDFVPTVVYFKSQTYGSLASRMSQVIWFSFASFVLHLCNFIFWISRLTYSGLLQMQEPWYISSDSSGWHVSHTAMPASRLPSSPRATRRRSHLWTLRGCLHELKTQIWRCGSQMMMMSSLNQNLLIKISIKSYTWTIYFVVHLIIRWRARCWYGLLVQFFLYTCIISVSCWMD